MTASRVAFGLGALLFLGASGLAAQPAPRPSETAQARELFERAVQLMESQDWSAALALLDASVRLHPTQVGLYDMGLCLKELGRTGEAIAAFERVLSEFPDRGSTARAQRARAELQELRGASGTVENPVNTPGAEVLVDGAGPAPPPLPAPPPDAPPPPPPVEQRARPERPAPPPRLGGGLRPVWFWSAAGLTGAAAVTTAILGALVVSGDADYRESRVRLSSDREAGRRLALFADVALGVSIVAAVGTVLLWARTDFGDRPVAQTALRPHALRVSATMSRGLGWIAIAGEL